MRFMVGFQISKGYDHARANMNKVASFPKQIAWELKPVQTQNKVFSYLNSVSY